MNMGVGRARVGQWYTRWDKGEIFQVVGYDADSRTIQVQTFDGDLDEMDLGTWVALPLALAEPPEDWTGPMDDVPREELGDSETEMSEVDWAEPLQSLREKGEAVEEAWEDTRSQDERDPEGEGAPLEAFTVEDRAAARRVND